MKSYINSDELYSITESTHQNPHHFLGMHELPDQSIYINAYQPYTKKIEVIDLDTNDIYPMVSVENTGVFTLELKKKINYKFRYTNFENVSWENYDPYSFEPTISDLDMYLFGQGTHYEIYNKLGAHKVTVNGIEGVAFAVWAPNASRVSVIGHFCGWDGRIYPMRLLGNSGIYELFIPGLNTEEIYKFEIKSRDGMILEKSDPYASYAEMRPGTASIVWDTSSYEWQDSDWQNEQMKNDSLKKPMAIYELHLGSWKRNDSEHGFINYRDLAHDLVDYLEEMNYTHIELMPVLEHPFDGSWGYQVTGYYAPTSRFGTPDDFMYFVDYMHQHNIGVLLDWVPAHFPKDAHGLRRFDGSALYEHDDARKGEHPHWGTMIFNYGRSEVKNFLIGNALFWIEKYHIDGLRVDAVASMLYLDYGKEAGQWIPNPHGGRENIEAVEFFKHMNSVIYGRNPGVVMIAEESTAWPGVSRPTNIGGLGFGLKWNMGWMNDFLRYASKDPIHKQYHHNDLTFSLVYAFTENFILVLSHDEVVHGKGSMINKMPGDYWQKFANLRCSYGFMYGHPGKKLLFMGCDFAQFDEWSEAKSLDWNLLEFDKHREMKTFVSDLNKTYRDEKALWEDDFTNRGFEWINCTDALESIVSFVRKDEKDEEHIIVISNFTPVPKYMHRIGVPRAGSYQEILNSDHQKYGGSGVLNEGILKTQSIAWDHKPNCLDIKVPPLGTIFLKYIK